MSCVWRRVYRFTEEERKRLWCSAGVVFPSAASCFDDDALFVEKTHSFAM